MGSKSSSIAVIGGADGPTAIFVAGNYSTGFIIGACILGGFILGVGLFFWKQRKKDSGR